MATAFFPTATRCNRVPWLSRTPVPRALKSCSRPVQRQASSSDDRVIPSPSFAIPLALLGITGVSSAAGAKPFAILTLILSLFLAFQATRVKFIFDKETLEVVIGEEAADQPENAFVGGENKWRFDSFVNWEFWWPDFPVLVYFKETQTKPEGQIHFFPIIFDGKTLYETMLERCGKTQNSGPKEE